MVKFCILLIFTITIASIPNVFADHVPNGSVESIFNSKNGTGLIALRVQEEVNIVFTYEFNDERFDGYAYYNIIEGDKRVTNSDNFTANESPKTFTFPYVPQKTGIFPFTKGVISNSGDFHREESQSIIVLDEFSKAMKFNGQCEKPFPEFTLVIKPDFSTGACVKMDTSFTLKERGWH